MVDPVVGAQLDYAYVVYGDGRAIACRSRAGQAEVADVTGGEAAAP